MTGESFTEAVLTAIRERLVWETGRRRANSLLEEITRIQERFRRLPVLDPRPTDEILGYDEHGLPR